jgi:uncharacterized protein (TIGR00290 family)
METNAAIFWSGGKDSSLALYKILQAKNYKVRYLVSTINSNYNRLSMHGIRQELIEEQAALIGIPLIKMYVSEGTNVEYEEKLKQIFRQLKKQNIHHIIYGDIFLEDLKQYRDKILEQNGMQGVYPLWQENTAQLVREFISLGFRTMVCSVNGNYLSQENVGKELTESYLSSLNKNIDPCGENGEFHTFCFAGPIFKNKINIEIGETVLRPVNGISFWYSDFLLKSKTQ